MGQISIKEIVRFQGVPKKNISDMDAKFTSKFYKDIFVDLGTELAFITTYYPQSNGNIEGLNRILEDMLRMYVMHRQNKWEMYLPLVEFAYNNGHQESIKMSLFVALYGRRCKTTISWSDPV